MTSYNVEIGEKARIGARFVARVRSEIQRAFAVEKGRRRLTQQSISKRLGVNRSVINRQLMGLENMTLRSAAELLWAIGWEPSFEALRREPSHGTNEIRLTFDEPNDLAMGDVIRAGSTTSQLVSVK